MPREDHFTSTPDAAAYYEANRGWYPDSRYGPDAPSRAEAERDAALDRADDARRRKAEDAARARGEYVPSAKMGLEVHSLDWTLSVGAGITDAIITPTREGVAAITFREPVSRAAVMTTLEGQYGHRMDFAERDGTVWVRIRQTMLGEDFLAADDGPPFL